MLQCRRGSVKKAVFVTVPGLQRTMSGREDAPKLLMLRCARDTQLIHLFLDLSSSPEPSSMRDWALSRKRASQFPTTPATHPIGNSRLAVEGRNDSVHAFLDIF